MPIRLPSLLKRAAPGAAVAAVQPISHLLDQVLVRFTARRREAETIAELRDELAARDRTIHEYEKSLAHSRKIFDRASEAARIGVWECDLSDQSLVWTDGVYDIFEIPRGSPITREMTLMCYPEASRRELTAVRSKAIEDRTGFTLDTEIVTMKGNHRWMRITATIESENGVAVRIFGMKQDITEEKILSDRTRYLADFDVMTGLANRIQFQARLESLGNPDCAKPMLGALILVDLDGFKQINDTFGHAVGDECLTQAAGRLAEVCHQAELVARIGGDEFAVLVSSEHDLDALERMAAGIVEGLSMQIEREGKMVPVGASVGISPIAGHDPEALYAEADTALYEAKASGRSTYRVFGRKSAAA